MTNRKCMGVWSAVILILVALPLMAAQAPPAGGPGQPGGTPPPAPVNLQVFPKDMTRQQVIPIMQQWNMALGVGCDHCHVPQVGAQPGANGQIPLNFPLDDKQTKKTARVMVKMMQGINGQLGSEIGKPAASVAQVQCATCHRGSAIPKLQ